MSSSEFISIKWVVVLSCNLQGIVVRLIYELTFMGVRYVPYIGIEVPLFQDLGPGPLRALGLFMVLIYHQNGLIFLFFRGFYQRIDVCISFVYQEITFLGYQPKGAKIYEGAVGSGRLAKGYLFLDAGVLDGGCFWLAMLSLKNEVRNLG